MMLHCLSTCTGPVKLVGIDWYNGGNGYVHTNSPCLAVVFDNGCAQIMKHELDNSELWCVYDNCTHSSLYSLYTCIHIIV